MGFSRFPTRSFGHSLPQCSGFKRNLWQLFGAIGRSVTGEPGFLSLGLCSKCSILQELKPFHEFHIRYRTRRADVLAPVP